MYKEILRPFLYLLPPEQAHYLTTALLSISSNLPKVNSIIESSFKFQNKSLHRELFGLKFPNPVGLAAGFDKNGQWIEALEMLGFGFIEVGTVTPLPQPGNDKPRLFRLVADEALINRMGFNNYGVDEMILNINKSKHKTPLGGNIGKNKLTQNENAVTDYLFAFEKLYDYVDYFTVNVSSPNTPGLRSLQGKVDLQRIFEAILNYRAKRNSQKAVLLKIAPDLEFSQIDEIISLVLEMKIDGLIATNTTLSREGLKSKFSLTSEQGGLSGKPVSAKSTSVIKHIHENSGGQIPIIGVGGIHSPDDALEKLNAGASLIQLYTGFIYEGPGLVKRINKRLARE